MGKRNISLKEMMSGIQPKESLVASLAIPSPDTFNLNGHEAYSQDKWLKLLTLLNTLKFETQFYRSVPQQILDFQITFHECASEDPYLTAQCLVYSRCVSDGMRSVTQLGSAMLPQYVSGKEWLKNFFSLWNKKIGSGGIVYRPDDMSRIIMFSKIMNGDRSALSNSLKKSFKKNLESLDSYSLLKYKYKLIDVINLVHPHPTGSQNQTVMVSGVPTPAITAIIKGMKASADTWEVAQSEAGKIVAQAQKEGKLDEEAAKKVLVQAKSDNWKSLLKDKKLGVLAALRNLRSIMLVNPDDETLEMLNLLIGNPELIMEGKIMPHQFDLAIESLKELNNKDQRIRTLIDTLQRSYEQSIPNLTDSLVGRNLVVLDCSGSMMTGMRKSGKMDKMLTSCMDKGKIIAATIAKATNADVIRFGSDAEYVDWNPGKSVFDLADDLIESMGATDLSSAWKLAAKSGRSYDRVFIISDNECNVGKTYKEYRNYVQKVGDPYVYSIDLAGYGTTAIAGPKVRYYFGYGYAMLDDISKNEFNPEFHLEKARKIIL